MFLKIGSSVRLKGLPALVCNNIVCKELFDLTLDMSKTIISKVVREDSDAH